MKVVQYEEEGFLRQSLLPNNMSAQLADKGIPHNPPDVRQLDCDLILKELNELLIKRGILTLADLNKDQNILSNTILLVMRKKVIGLYKAHPTGYSNSDPEITNNKE